ncbi:MAG: phosphomannomutase/phosphoglucomutase [Clostridia bacterium]|nr:phosphomannomutase/phosphoglucomutase [Clostridia bacterium]
MKDYKKLQNGSDIRGIALEGIEGQHVNLTEEVCRDIGKGFALWLINKTGKTENLRVAIGRDSRLSGETLLNYITSSMVESGLNVTNFGLASTPAMFMSTVTEGFMFDGSIMITASHLPFNRNGFKFFTKNGGLESSDIKEILAYSASEEVTNLPKGTLTTSEFMPTYSNILVNKVRSATNEEKPLLGYKIVVDAGNGAGGFYVNSVLKPLGADTTGSRFLEPDGSFPNHIPNPENKEAMESITEAVKENNADLGIIFDTDVDRAGAVLSDCSELNRNRIIAMLSAILLREHPGTTIVTDSITSTGLNEFITNLGGVHLRFKRGYKNVINKSIELNNNGQDSQLAIETSGHGALKENYFLDDGAYLVTKLLIELARAKKQGYTLESLIKDLKEPEESVEFRMNILLEDFKPYGQTVIDELTEYFKNKEGFSLANDNYEGVRVNADKNNGNGWFLLRLSLHDPLLPLNIESNEIGGTKIIANASAEFVKKYDKLDTSSLLNFIK